MVRGGKVSSKRKDKKRPWPKDKGSDDSDEEYVVSDEENEVSGDSDEDYCSGLDGCESEESYCSLAEEEEEEEVKKVRKAHRSKAKKSLDIFVVEEEEEEEEEEVKEEEEEDEKEEEEEIEEFKRTVRSKAQRSLSGWQRNGFKPSRKRRKVIYEDEDCEDLNHDADYSDDDDEEFTLDEDDFSEEEGPKVVKKKRSDMKAGKRRLQKKRTARCNKRKRRSTFSNKSSKRQKNHHRCGKVIWNEEDKIESKRCQRKRTVFVSSDSDFESSGSSDYEYTMSEEDSVIRETRESCGSLRTSLRNSSMSNIQEGIQQQRKPPGKKGKEKIEEVKTELGKQVCGICLSVEDKRKVRGTLNCCTHYFCFHCIMEWAKVESRCPLCKQRFKTISKPARSTTGVDLREVMIPVPERDQVYQPSEEELRSYLDPYESVFCTECNEGGDDALMLLCDICDSPAHTYCVGLGREVPEGNWYCHGCRPFALGSSSSQGHLPDQRSTTNNFSNSTFPAMNHFGEGIDLNSVSSAHASFAQGSGNLSSPRFSLGGIGSSPHFSGSGAPTVSRRRMLHRHIQQIISATRMNFLANRNEVNTVANMGGILLNSQTNQGNEATILHTGTTETGTMYHTFFDDRLRDSLLPSVQENDFLSPRLGQLSRQAVQEPTTNAIDRPVSVATRHGVAWMDSVSAQPIHDHNNRPNNGYDCEESYLHVEKEQLQSMVKNHLKHMSRDSNLGQSSLDDIVRSCMHTILAACGYEHRSNEVVSVPAPSICSHIELITGGGKTSLMKGCCSSCFDSFVRDVVKRILDTRTQPWLSLGL